MAASEFWWVPLLSVVIGGLLGGGGLVIQDKLNRRQERRALASTLLAEIRNIVKQAERRGHEAHFRTYLTHWQNGEWLDRRPTIEGLKRAEDHRPDPIFHANIDKLGLLGADLAKDVVEFYSMLEGIRFDLISIAAEETDIDQRKKLVTEDLAIWASMKSLADQLEDRLRQV